MASLPFLDVANYLVTEAATISGVVESRLGINQIIPDTPAAEVIMSSWTATTHSAGGTVDDYLMRLDVIFYVHMPANVPTDESALYNIVQAFVIHVRTVMDRTMGSLVEDTLATEGEFGIVKINNSPHRFGRVRILAGDILGNV